MGIEQKDFDLLQKIHSKHSLGKSMAILGDCYFYYNDNNPQEFKESFQLYTVDTFDLYGDPTYKLDLQNPIPDNFHQKYDTIIDAGTLYCCFDVAAVMRNLLLMLKPNGILIHITNLSGHYGRGFYSIHPAFFNDFYGANNFTNIISAYRTKYTQSEYKEMDLAKNHICGVNEDGFTWGDRSILTQYIHSDSLLFTAFRSPSNNGSLTHHPIQPVPDHYVK